MAMQCQHQVIIVGRTFGARSINQLLDYRRISTIVQSVDRRRIGMIGCLMDHMHISTIIVCVGSSTVPATGSFGWQCNASNGVIFVGILARILVYPQAYWHGSCLIHRSRAFGDACNYITLVHIFHHWQFFLCACGAVGRQLSRSQVTGVWGRT